MLDSTYWWPVKAVIVHPNGYLSAIGYGVYLSSNAGDSWKHIGVSYKLSCAKCMAVDKNGRLLVGTDAYGIFEYKPSNGRWNRIDTLMPEKYIAGLAIDHRNYIFAGTGNGNIYRSIDDGVHWTQLKLKDYDYENITVGQDGAIFIRTGLAYMISNDHGETWKDIRCPDPGVYCGTSDSSGTIYMGACGRIYVSRDSTRTWQCTYRNDTSRVFVKTILVHRDRRIFAAMESGQLLVSLDAGRTWSNSSFSLTDPHAVLCLASNRRGHIFVGTDGSGLYRSTDNGITWQRINKGFIFPELGG
jgi:photosystem II stability/assembly factor-like uncharacterized protein